MMLCKADFEELFPDIFSPAKADPVQRKAGGGAPSALQELSPLRRGEGSPPSHLATAPAQVEQI